MLAATDAVITTPQLFLYALFADAYLLLAALFHGCRDYALYFASSVLFAAIEIDMLPPPPII